MIRYVFIILMALVLSGFTDIPDWKKIDAEPAYEALRQACVHHKSSREQSEFCMEFWNKMLKSPQMKRNFFIRRYQPELLTDSGLLTGYYLPLIEGSREKSPLYPYPVWGVPKDFKQPYLPRQKIDQGALKHKETPILWVKDKLDLFFLHIQGSGKVKLPDGRIMSLNFAAKNGLPYTAIGKVMREEGMFAGNDEISLQSIKMRLRAQPQEIDRILWHNQSYVFFELKEAAVAAVGAQGVPLTAKGSLAVDPRHTPYGTPVLIRTILPEEAEPRWILAIAQDTGSAIKGEKRADWFVGSGKEAEKLAGPMKQAAEFYVLKRVSGDN